MHRIACVLAGVVAVAGCYRPAANQPCQVRCAVDDLTCPGGQECGANLICKTTGTPDCHGIASADANESGPDAPPGCYGVRLVDFQPVCTTDPTDRMLNNDIDTTSCTDGTTIGTMHDQAPAANAMKVCVFTGHDIKIGGELKVTGALPLAIVATHLLEIPDTNSIDVGAHGGVPGAGAVASASTGGCQTVDAVGSTLGGGGGPGGSFSSAGGTGGSYTGGPGMVAQGAIDLPTALRGGCPGGAGGTGDTATGTVAPGGPAGGGLYLIAGGTIVIHGKLGAGGGGGGRPTQHAGGGAGGGTGGMIVIEAPSITNLGVLYVDGGGGSGGAGMSPSLSGNDADGIQAAVGSTGTMATSAISGNGGTGAFRSPTDILPAMAGGPAVQNGGGGGGGGGVGFVVFKGTVSP
jgi:hypothetical protein